MGLVQHIDGDVHVNGSLTMKTLVPSASSVDNAAVKAAAGISASKLEGEFNLFVDQTGTVVAATRYLRIVRGVNATVIAIEAAITEAIATGGDRTVTIDLKRSTAGAAFASILTSTLVLDNTNVLRVLEAGAIANGALVDGDLLQLTVAVAGAAGAQAAGLLVSVTLREDAN